MGGYRSGRTKQHHSTDECIAIDTMALRKQGLFVGDTTSTTLTCTINGIKTEGETTTAHTMNIQVNRYRPGQPGPFSRWDATGHVTLSFGIKKGAEKPQKHRIDLPVV